MKRKTVFDIPMTRRIIFSIFSQQKVFYCYILLSIWIFIIVIGVYKYLGSATHYSNAVKPETLDAFHVQSMSTVRVMENRYNKVFQSCAPIASISLGAEGSIQGEFSLVGIVVIFRHGDRGPVNHVRNLESMDCEYHNSNDSAVFNEYLSFISSQWSGPISNTLYQFAGQVNPHVPVPTTKSCELGQLTSNGVVQHVKLGSLLRTAYFERLFDNSSIASNLFAYTTKYRRTFQSLSAFLYGFLRNGFRKIPLRTVSSMYFCFDDCACPAADVYAKAQKTENAKRLKSHPGIIKLIEEMSSTVYTMSDKSFIRDPHYLKDALLTYICHNKPLPCTKKKCVSLEHVLRVFSYIDWDVGKYAKSVRRQKVCLLTAYGFLKNIISHLLKIVSRERPRVVLYSAHDKSMANLLTTLGVTSNEAVSPVYASRVIFEVYARKEQTNNVSIKKFFFRLLFNGNDMTDRVKFCANSNSISTAQGTVCPFESLIRFLHDDYFAIFNSVNFKEACAVTRTR